MCALSLSLEMPLLIPFCRLVLQEHCTVHDPVLGASFPYSFSWFLQLLTVPQFSFQNNFSGQIAYESWTLSLYNVVFTVLPPLVIGVFDQFVSARILDRYPQLYILGQKNEFFTKTAFWLWVANALYHSLVSSFDSPNVEHFSHAHRSPRRFYTAFR